MTPTITIELDRPSFMDTWAPDYTEAQEDDADEALETVRERAEQRSGAKVIVVWREGYDHIDVEDDDELGSYYEAFRHWPEADEIAEALNAISIRRWDAEREQAEGYDLTAEQLAADAAIERERKHEAHGGDESPNREDCEVCIEDVDYFLRWGQWPGTLTPRGAR